MLHNVAGTPLILHVFNRVKAMGLFENVCVATDHIDIKELIESAGGKAFMTDPSLPSGTDRIISALAQMGKDYDYVVNVQGDEALISIDQLGPLVSLLNTDQVIDLATLCVSNFEKSSFKNPNCVKLVKSKDGNVLYFSRSSIPHHRDEAFTSFFQHVGVYAFSARAIGIIKDLKESDLEKIERLEQLRWMEAGIKIHACEVKGTLIGVDTREDIERVELLLS
ncbi:UNVERIFIED_CONTAM: hypothetical protein GTU68_017910 [Idotea baltica]|nr:hypothetical protein [Idotea baltica]